MHKLNFTLLLTEAKQVVFMLNNTVEGSLLPGGGGAF